MLTTLDITSCGTDVFVKLCYFKNNLTPEIPMDENGPKTKHAFHITNIVKNVSAFHALEGCTTTSQFLGLLYYIIYYLPITFQLA